MKECGLGCALVLILVPVVSPLVLAVAIDGCAHQGQLDPLDPHPHQPQQRALVEQGCCSNKPGKDGTAVASPIRAPDTS